MKTLITTFAALTIMTTATAMPQVGPPRAEDVQRISEAESLLKAVASAYHDAPALSDSLTISIASDVMLMDFLFDEDGNILMRMPGGIATVIDNTLYVEEDAVQDKYLLMPMQGDLQQMLTVIYGQGTVLPYHFPMRAQAGLATYLDSFTMGFFPMPELKSVRDVNVSDEPRRELQIVGEGGEARVHVHPETKLITSMILELNSPIDPEGGEKIIVKVQADPNISDSLDTAIAFDPGDREAVDDPKELVPPQPQMVRDGDPAPPFTLEVLGLDDEVALSDHEGKVVVLDFWATWCVPCIRALPELDEFAVWAKENDHPIAVYAVNVWEHRAQNKEDRKKVASDFWDKQEYALLTTLMDYDDSLITDFGYNSLPTTVIIGTDGNVFHTHVGYSANMKDMLKQYAMAALNQD